MRHKFLDIKWHWVIPFGLIVLAYVAGFAKGHLSTTVDQQDIETCNSRFGIKKRIEQCPLPMFRAPKDQEKKKKFYVAQIGKFADYLGNLNSGSFYSRAFTLGLSYTLLLDALVLCCAPLFPYAQDYEAKNTCVEIWAKTGVLLRRLEFKPVGISPWEA